MEKVIIVVSHIGSPWLQECLESLAYCKYPVVVCYSQEGAYDAEALYFAEKHKIREYVVLHDSMVIKDVSLFDNVFTLDGMIKIAPQMFLAKFVSPDLPPKPQNKLEAIGMECGWYQRLDAPILCPDFIDTQVFIEKNGRKNMVLENAYMIKYKGRWTL